MYGTQKIVFLPQCQSTNDELWALLDAGHVEPGVLLYAGFQTAGRGQRGTQWLAEPGVALLCSCLLHVAGRVEPESLFDLSRAVALALVDAIEAHTGLTLELKWPNDLYAGGQKLGGILIENRWSGQGLEWSVVGLGLNVNQQAFEPGLRATSLRLQTGRAWSIDFWAATLQQALSLCPAALANRALLRSRFDGRLRGLGKVGQYQTEQGERFAAIVLGTTEDGLLRLGSLAGEQKFALKEVAEVPELTL